MQESIRIVLVNAPNTEKAKEIARLVINEKLAACVNLIPEIHSIYTWKDKVEEESECMMIFKCQSTKVPQLEKRVLELHPYEVPEFISLNPEHVEEKYSKWVCGVE